MPWGSILEIAIPIPDSAPDTSHIDLRLVPDAGATFEEELTKCLSGVVQWDHLAVGTGKHKPTQVFPIDLFNPQAVQAATQPANKT